MKEEFRVWLGEDNRWHAQSQDLQQEGSFRADIFDENDRGLEAAMALIDALGFDSVVIAEALGLI